ncbi:MAG: D-alanine--D-alanine ligase [Candidatus Omnitrophota bacterium]|nr:D-alanine--D-alanine ligase [Candidatus Omnitrophota bacterium]
MIHTIGIAFNLKKKGIKDDAFEEYDEIETIQALRKELEALGFEVILFEQDKNFLKNILKRKPDFIFNIAEGIGNTRARESQVPCLLESLDIPYSGSDPLSLGITLDKYLTNIILKSANIPVPLMFLVKDDKDLVSLKYIFENEAPRVKARSFSQTLHVERNPDHASIQPDVTSGLVLSRRDKKRFIVKPRWEGSSKGIFLNSVVKNFKELKERVACVISKYKQPALVEEFLEKDEITVGVCGNKNPYLLGMMRIRLRDESQKIFLYSQEVKREWQSKIKYEPQKKIPPAIRRKIKKYALMAFSILELRDVARIDFRLDKNNIPKIIDINPLPGLSPFYSDLPILCRLQGRGYRDLVKAILKEALNRYGLIFPH